MNQDAKTQESNPSCERTTKKVPGNVISFFVVVFSFSSSSAQKPDLTPVGDLHSQAVGTRKGDPYLKGVVEEAPVTFLPCPECRPICVEWYNCIEVKCAKKPHLSGHR